jgi:pyruvate-formate lyase
MRGPNIHVRLHRNSPEKLVKRLAEVMLSGTNNVAIFNDEVIIKAWLRKGLQVEVKIVDPETLRPIEEQRKRD